MNFTQSIFTFCIGISLQLSVSAQGLLDHVAARAQYVVTVNNQSISQKADMATIGKMEFFNPAGDSMSASASHVITTIFCKPETCGARMVDRAYFFRIENDSLSGWYCLFGLKDADLFGKFLQQELKEKTEPNLQITHQGGYSLLHEGKMHAAWTKDFALLLIADKNDEYAFEENYSNIRATSYNQAMQDSIQAVELARAQAMADSIQAAEAAVEEQQRQAAKHPKKNQNTKKNTAQMQAELERAVSDSLAAVAAMQLEGSRAEEEASAALEKADKERKEKHQIEANGKASRLLGELINQGAAQSVSSLRSFSEAQKENFDIAIWINYSGTAFKSLNPYAHRGYRGMADSNRDTTESLTKLLANNYAVAYCLFDAGKITVTNKSIVNPEMSKLINGIYRAKGNKNFCKYIPGANLMGYASMSVNPEVVLKATRSILTKTYESTMGKEAKYITGMMDIAAIFTNDDVAYNLFKGDIAIAVTDLRPFKMSYLSYSYDDNFNRSETKQEKTEVLPEFVAMASVGKPEELNKILKAIEKMGGLRAEGEGVYLIEMPGQVGYKVYLAMENNILFCTNSEDLIHGKLKKGYPKNEQMSKEQRNLFTSYPIAYYWDRAKTFDMISKQPELKKGEKMTKMLNLFKDNLQEARITGTQQSGNAYVTNMQLDLKDASVNKPNPDKYAGKK